MSPPDPATPDPHPADAGLVLELAGLTRELALGGGRLARVGRIGGFRVGSKSTPTDLVTDIDRSVESWIVGELAARRPGDAIVGEEGTDSVGTSRVRWLIDPIDGTVNFALGLPHYAVSIAAELDGDVVAGCVHNPESGETFRAQRGERAVLEYVRGGADPLEDPVILGGPRPIELSRAVVGTGFSYDARTRARQGAVVAALLPRIGDIRRAGAASLDLCAVAAGRLDGYFEAGLNPWDWAAGLFIASQAGCMSSGLAARHPGGHFLAVAGPGTSLELFELLTELEADRVHD